MFDSSLPSTKIGRNEKCPCGSGKKYKHCCLMPGRPQMRAQGEHSFLTQVEVQKGSLIEAWAVSLASHAGRDWASDRLYRLSFENMVWFWFKELGNAVRIWLKKGLQNNSSLKQTLYANKSPLLEPPQFLDDRFWYHLFREVPDFLRAQIEEFLLSAFSAHYPQAVGKTLAHLWYACTRGEFVLTKARPLTGQHFASRTEIDSQKMLSYQELLTEFSASVNSNHRHLLASVGAGNEQLQLLFQQYWRDQHLLAGHTSSPLFEGRVAGQDVLAEVNFSLCPAGRILSSGVEGNMHISTHEDRTTFLVPICGQFVSCTRDDTSDPVAATLPLLLPLLKPFALESQKKVITASDASFILRMFTRSEEQKGLMTGLIFADQASVWGRAESESLHALWENERRATAKAITMELLERLKREWEATPADFRPFLQPVFQPASAEELRHVSLILESFFATTHGLGHLQMKASHITEFCHPEFHQEIRKLSKTKKGAQTKRWRLRRSGAETGHGTEKRLLEQTHLLRLLKRLEDSMQGRLRKSGLSLSFRCQLDSSKGAQHFVVDRDNSIFLVSGAAFAEPWHQILRAGDWALGHFLAQHYEEQGTKPEESWALAWKRLSLQPDLRMTKTSLDHAPTDWFDESESMTNEQKRFIEKINKLMALGQSDNEHEAALAMERAQDFIRSNNLNAARLMGSQSQASAEDLWTSFDTMHLYLGSKSLSTPMRRISSILVKHYGVHIVHETFPAPDSSDNEQVITLIGRRESLLMAEHVFDFLLDRMDKLWEVAKKEQKMPARHKMSYQLGLLKGFDVKLTQQAARKNAANDSARPEEGALVRLQDTKLKEFKCLLYPELRSMSESKTRLNAEAYSSGHSAGEDLRVNQPIAASRSGSTRSSEALLS